MHKNEHLDRLGTNIGKALKKGPFFLRFFDANDGIRSLAELQDVYHATVGHNSLLMMDFSPTAGKTQRLLIPHS